KGPHGSTNPFILRGAWNRQTGRPGTQNDLCFTCHDYNVYVVNEGLNNATGFSGAKPNLHAFHIQKATNRGQPAVCMDCHVAIPHGYNRDHLLGFTSDPAPYINRPLGGGLTQIDQWAQPGGWQFASCQTAMDAGCHGP
ncbi:MAG TPA: cytochrome c3 family protein, partial [Dehalococcoidia bacterium]|nr:cytochrome c3 family protein [Dehalococcoidia bacterium]